MNLLLLILIFNKLSLTLVKKSVPFKTVVKVKSKHFPKLNYVKDTMKISDFIVISNTLLVLFEGALSLKYFLCICGCCKNILSVPYFNTYASIEIPNRFYTSLIRLSLKGYSLLQSKTCPRRRSPRKKFSRNSPHD